MYKFLFLHWTFYRASRMVTGPSHGITVKSSVSIIWFRPLLGNLQIQNVSLFCHVKLSVSHFHSSNLSSLILPCGQCFKGQTKMIIFQSISEHVFNVTTPITVDDERFLYNKWLLPAAAVTTHHMHKQRPGWKELFATTNLIWILLMDISCTNTDLYRFFSDLVCTG